MDKFLFCPLLAGYSFQYGQNVMQQEIEVGPPRQRVNFVGAIHKVNATVLCRNDLEIEYFWAFFRKKQREPVGWLWAIKTDSSKMEVHECLFDANSVPQESDRQANIIKYSFPIFVRPIHRSAVDDDKIVDYWAAGMSLTASNYLEKLVNYDIAEAMKYFVRNNG